MAAPTRSTVAASSSPTRKRSCLPIRKYRRISATRFAPALAHVSPRCSAPAPTLNTRSMSTSISSSGATTSKCASGMCACRPNRWSTRRRKAHRFPSMKCRSRFRGRSPRTRLPMSARKSGAGDFAVPFANGSTLACISSVAALFGRRLLENFVGRRGNHLDILGNELVALDVFDEFRFDFVGEDFADAGVLFDVGPFGDQEEALRVFGVAAEHAVPNLRRRLVHGIAVRIVEGLEQADEFVLFALHHAEIVDVQVIALGGERLLRHEASPRGLRAALRWTDRK